MKIIRDSGLVASAARRDRAGRAAVSGAPSPGDTVTLSAEALRRVEASERGPAAMEPEERAQLVAALKAEVDSGSYRPDLRRTALFLVRDGEDTLA